MAEMQPDGKNKGAEVDMFGPRPRNQSAPFLDIPGSIVQSLAEIAT
jgi:hypothetical protein